MRLEDIEGLQASVQERAYCITSLVEMDRRAKSAPGEDFQIFCYFVPKALCRILRQNSVAVILAVLSLIWRY